MTPMNRRIPRDVWLLLAVAALATAWSLVHPVDYGTWCFEIIPGAMGVIALVAIAPRIRCSSLLYTVVAIHFVVLAAGAKYTYAEMPWFNWLRDVLHLSRNHFDRVGHFFQGFTAALLTREILLRGTGIGAGRILAALSVGMALAFSALYELLEWRWVALFYPDEGPQWLGMQGDPWDAQGDMLMALCGALVFVTMLSRLHDRSIQRIETQSGG
jgi:putative membrane protein